MPRFVIHFKGEGGCDYTIACNETLIGLDATTRDAALAEARKVCTDGALSGEAGYGPKVLLEVHSEEELPVDDWAAEDAATEAAKLATIDAASRRRRYEQLKREYEQLKREYEG